MKAGHRNLKVPFGTGKFAKLKNVRYLSWEDSFDVEFEDGLCILEPHSTIRRANTISAKAKFQSLEIEDWTESGFFVHYDTGETAEVSWSFIRELPPSAPAKVAETPAKYSPKRKR
ncbi:MAG: hypothetical protein WCS70_07050 [Verrucomicrobiota bacterium]